MLGEQQQKLDQAFIDLCEAAAQQAPEIEEGRRLPPHLPVNWPIMGCFPCLSQPKLAAINYHPWRA